MTDARSLFFQARIVDLRAVALQTLSQARTPIEVAEVGRALEQATEQVLDRLRDAGVLY